MRPVGRREFLLRSGFAGLMGRSALADTKIRALFGGDVIFSRGVAARMERTGESPLQLLAERFKSADLAFVNLESPFSDVPLQSQAEMVFRAEPAAVRHLVDAGIDAVSTANNHVRDCGSRGIEFTLEHLRKHGIVPVGTGRDEAEAYGGTVLERRGVKFGLLAYTFDQANGNYRDSDPRIAMLDIAKMQAGVAALRQKTGLGPVIVSMHAGVEYQAKPHPSQVAFARAAIEAGAKLVVGHHPHVVQTFEMYRGGLILYSLGNLVFDQRRPDTQRGLLAEAIFTPEGHLTGCSLIPVDIVDTAPRVSRKGGESTILLGSAGSESGVTRT